MKNIIKLFFVLSVLSVSQIASAFCTTDLRALPSNHAPFFASSNGGFCDTKAEANIQVHQVTGVQQVRLVPVPGSTTQFVNSGNIYHCPALAGWGGGLIGAILGNVLGQNMTTQGHRLGGLGAVVGATAGSQIACELVGPVRSSNIPPAMVLGPREQSVTQSNCNVGNVKDIKGISAEDCKRLRDAMMVNMPGHCTIGGVSYPEFIDNEPGCRAKWKEIAEKGNSVPIAQASVPESAPKVSQLQQAPSAPLPWGYMPPTATPSNPAKCFVTSPVSGEKQGCATITVVKPLDGETRGSWQSRVSSL